ncbi:hypothetical protein AHAS_Ahas16G0254500 [Arachis hypogaea]
MAFIVAQVQNILITFTTEKQGSHQKLESHVTWHLPTKEWTKVNTNGGAAKGNSGTAGCGGLLRNPQRRWIADFTTNIGYCSAFRVEL